MSDLIIVIRSPSNSGRTMNSNTNLVFNINPSKVNSDYPVKYIPRPYIGIGDSSPLITTATSYEVKSKTLSENSNHIDSVEVEVHSRVISEGTIAEGQRSLQWLVPESL